MAKKLAPPSPPASSSEEEEASSDEEQPPATSKAEPQTPTKNKDDDDEEEESVDESEEESDDDEEDPGSDNKKPQSSSAASSKAASDSGSGSESEDDSDSEAATAKLVTPISSRPMVDGPVLKVGDGEKPNGKPFFQRIWTPDDEIALLSAMAGFQPEHGPIKMNPNTIGDFFGFVKDSLSVGVSGTQLVDKIRRLKKKYSIMAARAKNNGKGLKFVTAHDQAVYELSKKVWGKVEGDDEREMVVNGKANGVAVNGGGKRGYPLLKEVVSEIEKKTGNSLVADALEMIDSDKASVLEKKLKKQRMAEIKHNMHELDLLKETMKLIMEGAERAMD